MSATTGSAAPSAGSVQFRNGGATGTLLATATSETVNGTTATFTVTTSSIAAGTYSDIQAFYIARHRLREQQLVRLRLDADHYAPGCYRRVEFPVTASCAG